MTKFCWKEETLHCTEKEQRHLRSTRPFMQVFSTSDRMESDCGVSWSARVEFLFSVNLIYILHFTSKKIYDCPYIHRNGNVQLYLPLEESAIIYTPSPIL